MTSDSVEKVDIGIGVDLTTNRIILRIRGDKEGMDLSLTCDIAERIRNSLSTSLELLSQHLIKQDIVQ